MKLENQKIKNGILSTYDEILKYYKYDGGTIILFKCNCVILIIKMYINIFHINNKCLFYSNANVSHVFISYV